MDFDFSFNWVNWGLYLSACWENDVDYTNPELPFDYIANYQRDVVDTDVRLYGGEIGLFHWLEENIDLLHEIYLAIDPKPTLDTTNPLYLDIIEGNGTSEINWAVSDIQCGIFNLDELETIENLLKSDVGITAQKELIKQKLYDPTNTWQVMTIYELEITYQAKCLLATYLFWCPYLISWVEMDKEEITDLESMASYLIAIRENDTERILSLYNYINENLSNEELRDF